MRGRAANPLIAAKREFTEETGIIVDGAFAPLEPVKQPDGKIVQAWASEGDGDASTISSNSFTMEWPSKSGRHSESPEVDRAAWFTIAESKEEFVKGQMSFIEQLSARLGSALESSDEDVRPPQAGVSDDPAPT